MSRTKAAPVPPEPVAAETGIVQTLIVYHGKRGLITIVIDIDNGCMSATRHLNFPGGATIKVHGERVNAVEFFGWWATEDKTVRATLHPAVKNGGLINEAEFVTI